MRFLSVLGVTAVAVAVLLMRRLGYGRGAAEGQDRGCGDDGGADRLWRAVAFASSRHDLVEALPDPLVQRRADGRIVFANRAYARLCGAAPATIIGTEAAPKVVEASAACLRADGARLIDEAIATADGVRWFSWTESSLADPDGAAAVVRVGREITERIGSERALDEARLRAEAASEAKTRFLATVSHEFRTPLTGILGMTDLLLDTGLTAEQATYARAVKTCGEAFLTLIDEILDFSRIEAGRLELARAPFDLAALAEGVVELLAPRAQGKGIDIAVLIARDVPKRVLGDADRLRQVLVNLAGNAVKFTEEGGVGLTVEGRDGAIQIIVHDTGPGIAPERIGAIFEEFEQGEDSPARRHDGAGLGLAIAKRIVDGMGGVITVDSRLGCGSEFRVLLPLAAAHEGQGAVPAARPLAGERVLIFADSPFTAPFLAQRIEAGGGAAAIVGSIETPRQRIGAEIWTALIADWALGEDAVRAAASAAAATGIRQRIVLVSPFERRTIGSPAATGYNAYLIKPVRARSLIEHLRGQARDSAPRRPAPQLSASSRVAGGARRVLLAEDNDVNALLAVKALEKLGAVVDWVRDGAAAVAAAKAALSGERPRFDLVLMDVRMPILDGREAARRIRALEAACPDTGRTRLVALTADARREDEAAARAAGFDAFLAKPFSFEALRAIVDGGAAAALSHFS